MKKIKVIKIGGNELSNLDFLPAFGKAIAALQEEYACVIVHGGGKAISDMMEALHIAPRFVNGQRVTDNKSLQVAEMLLSGKINKDIVFALTSAGLDGIGMSGVDRSLILVEPWGEDLGQVGRVVKVRKEILQQYCEDEVVSVISPISVGPGGKYNVNADHAAGQIAGALEVDEIVFVSNVAGVLIDGAPVSQLDASQIDTFIQSGDITDGMIPKVRSALEALEAGAKTARITNLEGLSHGAGTVIMNNGRKRNG